MTRLWLLDILRSLVLSYCWQNCWTSIYYTSKISCGDLYPWPWIWRQYIVIVGTIPLQRIVKSQIYFNFGTYRDFSYNLYNFPCIDLSWVSCVSTVIGPSKIIFPTGPRGYGCLSQSSPPGLYLLLLLPWLWFPFLTYLLNFPLRIKNLILSFSCL